MATSGDRLGDKIVDNLKAAGFYGAASSAQEARSRAEWKNIATTILQELKDNQEIDLLAGDIPVDPGSFEDSLHAPVTGIAVNEAVTLMGKTK